MSGTAQLPDGGIYIDNRDEASLVVSGRTGGWDIIHDKQTREWIRNGGTGPLSHDQADRLHARGLLTRSGATRGTSATVSLGDRILAPRHQMRRYPVLCVFHVHNWCNLSCTYCYTMADKVTRNRLGADLMIKAVDELVSGDLPTTCLEFHGGEPTMALHDIRRVVLHAEDVYRKAGKNVSFSIQTNGYRLSDECCSFLAEHDFSVRVSLDGDRATHNSARLNHAGRGSYDGVVAGITKLRSFGIVPHAVAVLHRANRDKITQMYDAMVDLGVASVRFLPVFKGGEMKDDSLWLNGREYFEAKWDLIEHILDRAARGLPTPILPNLVSGELGALTSFLRRYMCLRQPCGAGSNMVCIDDNGDLYPCEEMAGISEFRIGNLNHDTILDAFATPIVQHLRGRITAAIDGCRDCPWRQFCAGGCSHKSHTEFGDLRHGSEHCAYYQQIFRALLWLEHDRPGSWQVLGAQPGDLYASQEARQWH